VNSLFYSVIVVLFDCLAGHMQGCVVTPVLIWVLRFPFVSRKYSFYQKGFGGCPNVRRYCRT